MISQERMVGIIITLGIITLLRNDCSACTVGMVILSWRSLASDDWSYCRVPGSGLQAPRAAIWLCQVCRECWAQGAKLTWTKLTEDWWINQKANLGNITARRKIYWGSQVTIRRLFKESGWVTWMNECHQDAIITHPPFVSTDWVSWVEWQLSARIQGALFPNWCQWHKGRLALWGSQVQTPDNPLT